MVKVTCVTPTIRPEGLKIIQECLEKQTFQEYEWLTEIGIPGKGHDLNAAFNRMIRRAQGELIVFIEDYNKFPPNALQKWWDIYQKYPNTLFTAPLGKVKNWDDKPSWDWRAWTDGKILSETMPSTWQTCELDWGAIPKKILLEIGGFDERLDAWWSCDNLAVGKLAYLKGYSFLNYFNNPAIVFDHDFHQKHPFRERWNPTAANEIIAEYTPETKLPYL